MPRPVAAPSLTDGVLVVDKPSGPTSHDVVAVARRAAGARKVGHTGTLDPLASGVLPLVIGRATRLAQFFTSAEKVYEAEIELGTTTTTYDRAGAEVEQTGRRRAAGLTASEIDRALDRFRGDHLQQPPPYSAKKVGGDRAYDLARRNVEVNLKPVAVTVSALERLAWEGVRLRVRIACSAGFYVRAFAHALGEQLGTGAHLAALRRTRSGEFTLSEAVSLDLVDRDPRAAAQRLIPLDGLLRWLPAVTLTPPGAALAARGGFLSPAHLTGPGQVPASGRVRLLHPDGHLVAIGEPRLVGASRLLHPGVVLE